MITLYRLVRRWLGSLQLTVLLPLFAALLLLAMWATVLYQIERERSTAFKQAADTSDALAQTFEVRSTLVLQQVSQVTEFIKFEFEQHGARHALPELITGDIFPETIVNLITVVAADGSIIASNHATIDDRLAERDAFRTHIDNDVDRLYIGTPIFNPRAKQPVLQLSRRLNHADGSFAGVVVVALPPAYLTDFYDRSNLGTHGSVSLLGNDGAFRAVRVGNRMLMPDHPGEPLPSVASAPARHHDMIAASSPGQIPRVFSYRQLKDFPLVAIVGISAPEAYGKFSERRSVYLWSAASASAVILAFFALLTVLSHRLRKSMLAARQAQNTFRAVMDGGLDAFYVLKAERDAHNAIRDFVCVSANRRAAQLIGKSEDAAIGWKLGDLFPASRNNGFFEKCTQAAESNQAMEEESETVAADGSSRWLHHQWIPIPDGVAVTSRDISQRKHIDTENRNRRHFLQSLIDHLPTLIYVKSLRIGDHGRMIVWNRAAENVTGYASSKVVGKPLEEIFPPQSARQYQKLSDRMLADPQVIDVPEGPFRRPDGTLRYLRTISVPLFDENGAPEYLLGIGVDITERRAQEQELRTKQAELAAANDSSPLGLFHTDANGQCTYVNRAYEEMSGLSGEQALGAGWARSVHPQDRLKVFQAWRQSARECRPYQGIYRFVHQDGGVVWASVKMAPILVDGKVLGYVGSVDDITARRAAEKALQESEQHLRTIADTLPALVAYVDSEQRFRFNNLAYERVFGIPREAIRGKTMRELLGEALYQRAAPYVERALHGETVRFEVDELRNGEYRCTEATYTPQFDAEGGQVVGFHVMGHDITAKKIHERRLVEMTQIDSMTGLLNRAGFEKKLAEAMAHSRKSQALMAVIYMDIDHFKEINDSYGHPIGDALLKSFVARLLRTLRATDSVARLGGDEFSIIMEKLTKPEDAAAIARKIGSVMRHPFALEGHTVNVSASIGLAYYDGGTQGSDELVKLADDMLYQAKKAGRDTYRIAPLSHP